MQVPSDLALYAWYVQLPTRDPERQPLFDAPLFESGRARLMRTLLWEALLPHPEGSTLTHGEAAKRSGISRPSVKEYLPAHLVQPDALALSPSAGYALGVDFGRTHAVRAVLMDIGGDVAVREDGTPAIEPADQQDELDSAPGSFDVENIIARAVEHVGTLLEATGVEATDIIGVGIGLPTPATGESPSDAAIGLWRVYDAAGELRKALIKTRPEDEKATWRSKPIRSDNDTNLSAIWNHLRGTERADNTLFVKWMAGVRAAFILDGRLYRGPGGVAGALPHIAVRGIEPEMARPCGWTKCPVGGGCIHGQAPIERLREMVPRLGAGELLWAGPIMEAARNNSALRDYVHAVVRTIGEAVAPVATALNPELIVLGGALGARSHAIALHKFVEGVEAQTNFTFGENGVVVTASTEKNRTTAKGAAALALIEFGTEYLLGRTSSSKPQPKSSRTSDSATGARGRPGRARAASAAH